LTWSYGIHGVGEYSSLVFSYWARRHRPSLSDMRRKLIYHHHGTLL